MGEDIKICFIGDSLVNGACDKTMLGWTGRVCADAYDKGVNLTYYNLGVRANTSTDILKRWKSECESRLAKSDDARIVLSCGVNDTILQEGNCKVSTQRSCENISNLLAEASEYKFLLVSPPPVNDDAHNSRIAVLSNAFFEIADSFDVPFIDIFTPLSKDMNYIQDIASNHDCYPLGYHPTHIGYSMMANNICKSHYWWFN